MTVVTLQAVIVSVLDSVPNSLMIPRGCGCIAAVAMGVGTMFGSQRMTTTVGTVTLSYKPLWFHVMSWIPAMGPLAAHETWHASGLAPVQNMLMRSF